MSILRSYIAAVRSRALLGLAVVAAAAAPTLALAQLPATAWRLQAGGFLQSADAEMRIDGTTSNGTNVNLDDFGLDGSDTSYLLGAEWRFAERHRLGLYSFNIERDASKTITKSITIGDTTYPVGVSLSSNFKTTVTPITYMYSFMKDADSELAGTIGVHWSKIELSVNGATSVGGSATKSTTAKLDAPLPLIGLRYDQAFGQDWLLTAAGSYFQVKAGDVDGSFGNFHLATEYAFTRNFAVGASYTYFTVRADASSSDWKGRVEYDYSGPALYLVGRF